MSTAAPRPGTVPADMERSRAWTSRFVSSPAALPVSFLLDGKPVSGIPADWDPSSRTNRIDASIVDTVITGRHSKTGLTVRVEWREYLDFPVVEWMAELSNESDRPTPIISDLKALDAGFDGISPMLTHGSGDFCSAEGYMPTDSPVPVGDTLGFAPTGGRACDRAFPYFRLGFAGCGLSLAIGWPAQWAATFTGTPRGVLIRAGQEKTRLRLNPGETVRTPRIALMSWTGDARRAANLWRRWYRVHVLPRSDGLPLRPRIGGHGTDEGEEFTAATETNQIKYIEKWAQVGIPIDVWWIDAGWYPCRDAAGVGQWWNVGSWEPDPARFPRGFKPVSDFAAAHGADLLVWFEPERVTAGSRLDREHPEWLLRAKGDDNRLLNIGDPACRQWLTDHVCRMIREQGIRIYRQDHNFEPLRHWRENEPEDRQGMNENLHVQGYLRYWDDLLARNPGLWIDSCASGGRRNDFETMRRSVPLHYTDFGYGDHPVKLSFHHTMFEWIPYFKEVTLSWDLAGRIRWDKEVDSFSYHCGLGPMIMPAIDIRRDDYDWELAKRLLAILRRAADLMLRGDYYPLTPFHRTTEKWVGRQFDCPEAAVGFIQGIRLPASPDETLTVHPQALLPDGIYILENPETGETREVPGRTLLADGFTFSLPQRRGEIWFYRLLVPA